MSEPEGRPAAEDGPERGAAGEEATRRRRRAAVFGDVLPETTGDERGDAGERGGSGSEEWLRAQVPPHHG